MWTVEQTGGGCTADVHRMTDDRTGAALVVIANDGNQCAWTTSDLEPEYRSFQVAVFASGAWDGDDEDRDPLAAVWVEETDVDVCSVLLGVLGDAGVVTGDLDPHGHSETVHALAVALLDAREVHA